VTYFKTLYGNRFDITDYIIISAQNFASWVIPLTD